MKEYLKKLPGEIRDLVNLSREIVSSGDSAYLVGGFVRDLILGAKNLDLDIVIEGDGIKFAEDMARILKAKLIRHRRFQTATVILTPNLKIDVATARTEYYPKPAHLPMVTPSTLRDDLKRRDFTINAMAISISGEGFGRLIDFFDGKKDIAEKKIKVLHDLSFIDDPTRILRAIRFEKRYDFNIETKALAYLREAVGLGMLDKTQPQRLRDELVLILKEEEPLKPIKRLQELAGLGFINKHLSCSKKTPVLFRSIVREADWFKKIYFQRRPLDLWLVYLMGLFDSLNVENVRAVCKKFVFSKGEVKRILTYKKISRNFMQGLNQDDVLPSRIFRLLEPLSYEVIILIKAKYKECNVQRRIEDFFKSYHGLRIHVSGDDLKRLGIKPGPQYQKIFARILHAKLNGWVKNKEEELAVIKKLVKSR